MKPMLIITLSLHSHPQLQFNHYSQSQRQITPSALRHRSRLNLPSKNMTMVVGATFATRYRAPHAIQLTRQSSMLLVVCDGMCQFCLLNRLVWKLAFR